MNQRSSLIVICFILLCRKVKTEQQTLLEQNDCSTVKTKWIEQKLDHFDENEHRTWQMRYMSNDEFFQQGSPVFIYVGGEWLVSACTVHQKSGTHMYDMAREHHGYLFATEHRFYGESQPTSDLSNENLKYLSAKQALADLAHFIRTMKETIPGISDSKFILIGGSYAAALITWFKKLYPDLVVGCWASSAALHFTVNFKQYIEVIGESIRLFGGIDCYNRLENGFKKIETDFGNIIKNELKICQNINEINDFDIWTTFNEMKNIFSQTVQHNLNNIKNACYIIMNAEDGAKGVLNYVIQNKIKQCQNENEGNYEMQKLCMSGCFDFTYNHFKEQHKNRKNTNIRQWAYQSCNELGSFQTLESSKQPFGSKSPLKFYINLCKDLFGEQFTEDYISMKVQETNDYFGGLEPNVENVYFTYGELDPWRPLGIQNSRATIIPKYSHVQDIYSISHLDSAEMRASKERIAELVREWVRADNIEDKSILSKIFLFFNSIRI